MLLLLHLLLFAHKRNEGQVHVYTLATAAVHPSSGHCICGPEHDLHRECGTYVKRYMYDDFVGRGAETEERSKINRRIIFCVRDSNDWRSRN